MSLYSSRLWCVSQVLSPPSPKPPPTFLWSLTKPSSPALHKSFPSPLVLLSTAKGRYPLLVLLSPAPPHPSTAHRPGEAPQHCHTCPKPVLSPALVQKNPIWSINYAAKFTPQTLAGASTELRADEHQTGGNRGKIPAWMQNSSILPKRGAFVGVGG